MRISPVSHVNKTGIYFKSMGLTVSSYKDIYGIERETQHTTGIRNDISLVHLANILKYRFKYFDKVNIMPMNVSDGTEAYAFANAIIRNEGIDTFIQKYSPILASDVIPQIINNYGEKGLIQLYDSEKHLFDGIGFQVLTKVNYEDYKDLIINQIGMPDKLYKLNPEYKKFFKFSIADLQERINTLQDKGNSVISIRNCLRQSFGDTKSAMIILRLINKMDGASLLITGDYDRIKMPKTMSILNEQMVELKHNIWGLKSYDFVKNNVMEFL